jgi:transcriptional regulator with XRE-family HTH domain
MSIGANIKRLRKERGMTQRYLGLSVGFNEISADVRIAQYENGARTPKKDMLEKLAQILDVDYAILSEPNADKYLSVLTEIEGLENFCSDVLLEIQRIRQKIGDILWNMEA